MLSTRTVTEHCRQQALDLGFEICGFAPVEVKLHRDYYLRWIAEQQHGTMSWMERNNERRLDPSKVLPGARSIVVVGLNYYQEEPGNRGRIAKYALGKDYHKIMYKKLKRLCAWMREQGGEQKPYVDTGPVLEKPVAAQAGLGWIGKNTLLLHRRHGTFLFIGVIITTLPLDADSVENDHCGNCSRCLDICPTHAFPAPYQLDASRCISYLTIEHQGSIPLEFREAIGDRLYGCDDCLDVCPWNRWAQTTRERRFLFRGLPDPAETLAWDEEDFRKQFQGTPLMRLKLPRWKRNVCVVLGNIGNEADLAKLAPLVECRDAMIAEHARWAVNRIHQRCGNRFQGVNGDVIQYGPLFEQLEDTALGAWIPGLQKKLKAHLFESNNGHLETWLGALQSLPSFPCQSYDLQSTVRFEGPLNLPLVNRELKKLHPWRKGPIHIGDLKIDTEWRSDWKWDRLKNHVAPLEGRTVLDIGCGNGYYLYRMLGAGAKLALGIDPFLLFVMQFWAIKHFGPPNLPAWVLPLGWEDLPPELPFFDTVFSMGVLYHRRNAREFLGQLKNYVRPGGELVLETLVIDGKEGDVLVPEGRYAKMRNVWYIPSVAELEATLAHAGWRNIRCIDVTPTSVEEQRGTDWMTFESLQDFLDPVDASKTVEGYPAPVRAILLAEK